MTPRIICTGDRGLRESTRVAVICSSLSMHLTAVVSTNVGNAAILVATSTLPPREQGSIKSACCFWWQPFPMMTTANCAGKRLASCCWKRFKFLLKHSQYDHFSYLSHKCRKTPHLKHKNLFPSILKYWTVTCRYVFVFRKQFLLTLQIFKYLCHEVYKSGNRKENVKLGE